MSEKTKTNGKKAKAEKRICTDYSILSFTEIILKYANANLKISLHVFFIRTSNLRKPCVVLNFFDFEA